MNVFAGPWKVICVLCLLVLSLAAAADPNTSTLFTEQATLAVQISAPIADVMHDRDDNRYHDGTLAYVDSSGKTHELPVRLRARGNYRRRKNVCPFAPLRLNFDAEQGDEPLFAGQDKLKLVTHCDSVRHNYEPYLLKEYLAYRFMQLLTPRSYGVRLLRVTYRDTSKGNKSLTRYAFLIEDKKHLAARIGKPLALVRRVELDQLAPEQTNLVAAFEYFIGNTDFSTVLGAKDEACCHNITLLKDADNRYLPIPYDFDQSGIVNIPYAAPNPKYRLMAVTDRLYRGLCRNNNLLDATLNQFRDLESEFHQLVDKQEGLKSSSRRRMHRFIGKFYDDIAGSTDITNNLLDTCS